MVTGERSGPGGPPSTPPPPPPAYCSSRGSGPWNMICRLAGLIGTQGQADWTRPKYERTIRTVMGGGTWMFFLLLFCFVLFCFFFFALKRPWYRSPSNLMGSCPGMIFLASGWIFFRATWCAFNFPRGFLMSSTGCPDRGTVDCGLLTCLSSEQIPYSTIGAIR